MRRLPFSALQAHTAVAFPRPTRKLSLAQVGVVFILLVFTLQLIVSWRMLGRVVADNNHDNLMSSVVDQQQSPSVKHPSWRRMKHTVPERIDGTFNGVPMQLMTAHKPATRVHCVGDNYVYDAVDAAQQDDDGIQRQGWQQRSCYFRFLCFNTTSSRFVVFQSAPEQSLSRVLAHTGRGAPPHFHVSTSFRAAPPNITQAVAIGGINQKWGRKNIRRMRWFPDVVDWKARNHSGRDDNTTDDTDPHTARQQQQQLTFYAMPASVLWLPYHSLNGANPGHAVWDDFMSLYTLMDMFHLTELEPLLMRYVLNDGQRGQWASCDFRDDKKAACAKILGKFGPMMMGTANGYKFTTTEDYEFRPNKAGQSDLVCAAHGAAGLGALTDHGLLKSHGWEPEDYKITHNHGRGGLIRRFRQHIMENLGLGHLAVVPREAPHRVVVSIQASDIPARRLRFEEELETLKELTNAVVEPHRMKDLSLTEQLELAGQTAVYMTPCGGGAVTGMFLPEGASIILYYQHNGGVKNNHGTGLPGMLDWDVFSAMTHIRVHWYPMAARHDYVGQASLLFLVRHELFLIESLPAVPV